MKTYRPHSHHLFLLIPCFGLLVLLGSCVKPSGQVAISHPAMAEIDSLLWSRPDSAFMELRRFAERPEADSLDTFDGHCFQLLLSELFYKNDCAQTNREELLKAVGYFDSLASSNKDAFLTFLDARGHYINGVGYYERDSVVEACQEYLKAVELMEERFEERELTGRKVQFMALAYTRLTRVFSDHYLHDQTIQFAKLSLHYYSKQSNKQPWHETWLLNELGSQYEMKNNWDSANYCYERAVEVLNDTTNSIYRDVVNHRVILDYKNDHLAGKAISQMHGLLSRAEGNKEYLARCLSIGAIFYHEKLLDSAWYYLDKVYQETTSTSSKKQAAEWLSQLCETRGMDSQAFEYSHYLASFANQEENGNSVKSQLADSYHLFREEHQQWQYKRAVEKQTNMLFFLLVGVFILLIAVLLYHRYKWKKKAIKDHSSYDVDDSAKSLENYEHFLKEPICQQIMESMLDNDIKRSASPQDYRELILSERQLQQLALVVNRYYGSFGKQLELHGLTKKPTLINLCHIYLLGMNEKQAGILLNKDYSTIKKYEKKLKNAFSTQDSLSLFLRNMIIND